MEEAPRKVGLGWAPGLREEGSGLDLREEGCGLDSWV